MKSLDERKPARKMADVPQEVLSALNQGLTSTLNLTEAMVVDQGVLWSHVTGSKSPELSHLGFSKKVERLGRQILDQKGEDGWKEFADHPSDTVRGWACFALAASASKLDYKIELFKKFGSDAHFSVREWSWIALRPLLVSALEFSITRMAEQATDPSPYLRRFAAEVLRPRGVWCTHIPDLKSNPELGVSILEPLRFESSKYIQDSVGNWINDASKTRPDWALDLARRWRDESNDPMQERIIRHGLRSL